MTDDFNEFFDDNTHWVEQGSEPMRGPSRRTAEIPQGDAQATCTAQAQAYQWHYHRYRHRALLIGGGHFRRTKLIAWRDSRSNQSTAIADYPGPGYGESDSP